MCSLVVEGLWPFDLVAVGFKIFQLVIEPRIAIGNIVLNAVKLHLLQSKYIAMSLQHRCMRCCITHIPGPVVALSEGLCNFPRDPKLTGSS